LLFSASGLEIVALIESKEQTVGASVAGVGDLGDGLVGDGVSDVCDDVGNGVVGNDLEDVGDGVGDGAEDSVGNSVGAEAGNSIGDSVGDGVGDMGRKVHFAGTSAGHV